MSIVRIESASASSGNNRRDGFEQDLEIEPEVLALNVLHIQLDLFLKIDFAASKNLPEASQAGRGCEAAAVGWLVEGDLARQRWPWADQ
jgi:hypothetical protein